MDAEAKLQQYLLLGKSAKGRSICELIAKATAEPGLFTFGELLDLPSVQEVRNEAAGARGGDAGGLTPHLLISQLASGEFASFRALLELFCYGTWSEYQGKQRPAGGGLQRAPARFAAATVLCCCAAVASARAGRRRCCCCRRRPRSAQGQLAAAVSTAGGQAETADGRVAGRAAEGAAGAGGAAARHRHSSAAGDQLPAVR